MKNNSQGQISARFSLVWVLVFGIALGFFLYYRRIYPYGHRVGCMPNTIGSLGAYAQEHQGWYPISGRTPLDSLRVFYPRELEEELAGITGNRRETLRRLQNNLPLDETVSSWHYNPGLRSDDDPRIALIWERQEGVTVNGRRQPGHVVGFVNLSVSQVSSQNWTNFLAEQEKLRSEALAKREQVGKKE